MNQKTHNQQLKTITSGCLPIKQDNIDTDQIFPARFMKITDKKDLAAKLFHDLRYNEDGSINKSFILNNPEYRNHRILIGGYNFGCGSSREHAPWSILQYGFRVIISSRFAEIFKNNSLINGLLIIEVKQDILNRIFSEVEKNNQYQLTIDLPSQIIIFENSDTAHFQVEPFRKKSLIEGVDILEAKKQYDQKNNKKNVDSTADLNYLLTKIDTIKKYEKKHNK